MRKTLLTIIVLLGLYHFGMGQNVNFNGTPNQVKQSNTNGQVASDGGLINIEDGGSIFIPNAFTPNNDGVNDVFYIPSISNLRDFQFSMFDRWGNEVYQTQNPNFEWDGKINSKEIPSGIYVYVLSAITEKGVGVKRSGTISVMR